VFIGIVVAALVIGFVILMSMLPRWINDRRDKGDQGGGTGVS
jgi:hypothetical protein